MADLLVLTPSGPGSMTARGRSSRRRRSTRIAPALAGIPPGPNRASSSSHLCHLSCFRNPTREPTSARQEQARLGVDLGRSPGRRVPPDCRATLLLDGDPSMRSQHPNRRYPARARAAAHSGPPLPGGGIGKKLAESVPVVESVYPRPRLPCDRDPRKNGREEPPRENQEPPIDTKPWHGCWSTRHSLPMRGRRAPTPQHSGP